MSMCIDSLKLIPFSNIVKSNINITNNFQILKIFQLQTKYFKLCTLIWKLLVIY